VIDGILWKEMMLHATRAMRWEERTVRVKGGETAEKCVAVVTFSRKKNATRERHVKVENTLFCTMTN